MTRDLMGQAKSASERGNFEAAIALLCPLAEAGDSDAQYQLGFLVLTECAECDLLSGREAFSLFRAAADD
jgi:hypothetical protein